MDEMRELAFEKVSDGTREKCPICKRTFWRGWVKNHIHGVAKGELFRREMGLTKKTPHFNFMKQHIVEFGSKKLWVEGGKNHGR